jgi:hypothetical protein
MHERKENQLERRMLSLSLGVLKKARCHWHNLEMSKASTTGIHLQRLEEEGRLGGAVDPECEKTSAYIIAPIYVIISHGMW